MTKLVEQRKKMHEQMQKMMPGNEQNARSMRRMIMGMGMDMSDDHSHHH